MLVAGDERRIVELLRTTWRAYERDRAGYLAAAMVYYAMISLVPLLLLLLAALGLLLRFSPLAGDVEQQLLLLIEANLGEEAETTIEGLLGALRRESIIATAIGLGGLLLAASVLFRHLRLGFRAIWKHDPPRIAAAARDALLQTLLERVVAFLLVLGGGVFLLVALLSIAAAQWLVGRLGGQWSVGELAGGWLLATLLSLLLAAATFAVLFRVLPPVALRWRDTRLAVLLSATAWVVAAEALSLYATYFGGEPSAYGALGGLLAVMLWMNVVSKILFFGAELCRVVADRNP